MKMKKLVILTGAGMSAESGFSTFRDSGGLWEKYNVEDVASPDGWERNPEMVLDFYNRLRKQLMQAKPNAGHQGLYELEHDYDVKIITQNVDDLHERAGNHNVLHLHGELMKVRPVNRENEIYTLTPENCEIHLGDKDKNGIQLRPHIVWFGEPVPMIEKAIEWTEEADIFVIIGTSLNVYPAAGLIHYVRKGIPIYLIDPQEVHIPSGLPVHIIHKGAGEGVKELVQILKSHL
jgi:NAD-dependent deacetylase (regulatory protein SIR2-like protein)